MFNLWLIRRFLTSGRRWLSLPSGISLAGMAIGVACLFVAMGVISGFEKTLRKAVLDVAGHLIVIRQSDRVQSAEEAYAKIKKIAPEVIAYTPFVQLEAVVAVSGRITGIVMQGIEVATVDSVLNLRGRLLSGDFAFSPIEEVPQVLIGKGLSNKLGLEVGHVFSIVLPSPSRTDSSSFSPKAQKFRVAGILSLGKIDYDDRFVVADLATVQKFADIGDGFSGLRLKLKDEDRATPIMRLLSEELGAAYWVSSWIEVNPNLFEAVRLERAIIFYILLVLIVAAAFNISSNLFVSVLQRFHDVAILRAMGYPRREIMKMFVLHGLFFGAFGTLLGLVLGLILCGCFILLQKFFVVMPPEIYRIEQVGVDIRLLDVAMIVAAALVICVLSTLVPAFKASRLDPVEGLRYE